VTLACRFDVSVHLRRLRVRAAMPASPDLNHKHLPSRAFGAAIDEDLPTTM
jgi:hypothetical protein